MPAVTQIPTENLPRFNVRHEADRIYWKSGQGDLLRGGSTNSFQSVDNFNNFISPGVAKLTKGEQTSTMEHFKSGNAVNFDYPGDVPKVPLASSPPPPPPPPVNLMGPPSNFWESNDASKLNKPTADGAPPTEDFFSNSYHLNDKFGGALGNFKINNQNNNFSGEYDTFHHPNYYGNLPHPPPLQHGLPAFRNSTIPETLRQIALQLDSDFFNVSTHLDVIREQGESRYHSALIENGRLLEEIARLEANMDSLMNRNASLAETYRQKVNSFEEYKVEVTAKHASIVSAIERKLAEENSDLRSRIRKFHEKLETKTARVLALESIVSECRRIVSSSFPCHDKQNNNEKNYAISLEKISILLESQNGSDEKSAANSNNMNRTNTPPDFFVSSDSSSSSSAHKANPTNDVENAVKIACKYLDAFTMLKKVKTDDSKASHPLQNSNYGLEITAATKELRKLMQKHCNFANHSSIVQKLESIIVSRALSAKKSNSSNNSSGKNDETNNLTNKFSYSLFSNRDDRNSYESSLFIDIPYSLSLMVNMTPTNLLSIVSVCVRYDNWQWLQICKDAWFLKMLDLKFDGMPQTSHPAIYAIKGMDQAGCLEFMNYLNLVGAVSSRAIDDETHENLWHFAITRKDDRLIDFFLGVDRFSRVLELKNSTGKTPLDLVTGPLKDKLCTAVVLSYSFEASELYRRAHYAEALGIYEKALEYQNKTSSSVSGGTAPTHIRDNMAKLQYNKARSLMHLNRWIDAIQCCEDCISINPSYLNAYSTEIQAYEMLYDWASAFSVCQRLREVNASAINDAKMQHLQNQMNASMFQILGISRNSSLPDVKQAFNKLCVIWHPDKASNKESADVKKRHENHFNRIVQAKDYLLSSSNRRLESMKKETTYIPPSYTSPPAASSENGTKDTNTPQAKVGASSKGTSHTNTTTKKTTDLNSGADTAEATASGPSLTRQSSNAPSDADGAASSGSVSTPNYFVMSLEQLEIAKSSMEKSLESLCAQKSEKLQELEGLEKKKKNVSSTNYFPQMVVVTREIKQIHSKIDAKNAALQEIQKALIQVANNASSSKDVSASSSPTGERGSFEEVLISDVSADATVDVNDVNLPETVHVTSSAQRFHSENQSVESNSAFQFVGRKIDPDTASLKSTVSDTGIKNRNEAFSNVAGKKSGKEESTQDNLANKNSKGPSIQHTHRNNSGHLEHRLPGEQNIEGVNHDKGIPASSQNNKSFDTQVSHSNNYLRDEGKRFASGVSIPSTANTSSVNDSKGGRKISYNDENLITSRSRKNDASGTSASGELKKSSLTRLPKAKEVTKHEKGTSSVPNSNNDVRQSKSVTSKQHRSSSYTKPSVSAAPKYSFGNNGASQPFLVSPSSVANPKLFRCTSEIKENEPVDGNFMKESLTSQKFRISSPVLQAGDSLDDSSNMHSPRYKTCPPLSSPNASRSEDEVFASPATSIEQQSKTVKDDFQPYQIGEPTVTPLATPRETSPVTEFEVTADELSGVAVQFNSEDENYFDEGDFTAAVKSFNELSNFKSRIAADFESRETLNVPAENFYNIKRFSSEPVTKMLEILEESSELTSENWFDVTFGKGNNSASNGERRWKSSYNTFNGTFPIPEFTRSEDTASLSDDSESIFDDTFSGNPNNFSSFPLNYDNEDNNFDNPIDEFSFINNENVGSPSWKRSPRNFVNQLTHPSFFEGNVDESAEGVESMPPYSSFRSSSDEEEVLINERNSFVGTNKYEPASTG